MTMISAHSRIVAALLAAALGIASPQASRAQDPKPPADELEKLLEKIEKKEKVETPKDKDKDAGKEPEKAKPADPAKPQPKDKEAEKPKLPGEPSPSKEASLEKMLEKLEAKEKAEAARDKDKPADKDKGQKPGEVAPKDAELDKLLEGLGQTKDAPSPEDKKPGGQGDGPPPPKGDQPMPEDLKGGEKDLDKELERITGKQQKPKNQRERKAEDETGPLGQVIKEMRDVEERLGKPDTGDATRKKQSEIVKNLDQLIEAMKNAPSQSMAMKMMKGGKKPGGPPQQPGQPGDQPGAMAQGPPPSKPADPNKKTTLPDGLVKSIWGQLPSQFRDEMGNVSSEHPLPTRAELIKLYYMALGNKSANREE
jgi:hypothetical protein